MLSELTSLERTSTNHLDPLREAGHELPEQLDPRERVGVGVERGRGEVGEHARHRHEARHGRAQQRRHATAALQVVVGLRKRSIRAGPNFQGAHYNLFGLNMLRARIFPLVPFCHIFVVQQELQKVDFFPSFDQSGCQSRKTICTFQFQMPLLFKA